ncbi:MAG: transcriptional regulator [Bacillaceae bacterium]|nr:transcriptional regulator [Bacillaceae bacterium]
MTSFELYVLMPALIVIMLTQSTFLFIDAKKRNSYAWFWGIWGLITAPLPLLFYYLFVIRPQKTKK